MSAHGLSYPQIPTLKSFAPASIEAQLAFLEPATPSEVFAALKAGAHGVKAFPAEMLTPSVIKSWRSVLPPEVPVVAVGGINTDNARAYWQAGVSGFGLGGALYKAGKSIDAIAADAAQFVSLLRNLDQS
jgi:2-dehydro-3-deoxyphosphogalactonate aldolase